MEPFIGRKEEMAILEDLWSGRGKKACVVYGRRRIGKSEILKRFCEGRRSIYIECVQGSLVDNLHNMAIVMSVFDGREREDYRFLKDALDDILTACKADRTAVVFDEIPYILYTEDHVASTFQHFVDAVTRETDSMVIICGSSMSVMIKETTEYDRPLYGRFSVSMEVGPLSFHECAGFHPTMSDIDRVRLYLTVGGVPKYHLDSDTDTYREYIERHFLSRTADMDDEASVMISAEFVPSDRYMAIVNAISEGKIILKDITDASGLDNARCLKYIDNMIDVGIIGIEKPMFGATKRPVYYIKDNMIAFCQDVIKKSRAYSLSDASKKYDAVSVKIDTFLGRRFEMLCTEYVTATRDCLEIGRWWGSDGKGEDKEVREIDIAATVLENGVRVSLFGECKFRNRIMGEGVLRELERDSKLARTDATHRYVLFSISGFSEDLVDAAEAEGVELVGLKEITSGWENADR